MKEKENYEPAPVTLVKMLNSETKEIIDVIIADFKNPDIEPGKVLYIPDLETVNKFRAFYKCPKCKTIFSDITQNPQYKPGDIEAPYRKCSRCSPRPKGYYEMEKKRQEHKYYEPDGTPRKLTPAEGLLKSKVNFN